MKLAKNEDRAVYAVPEVGQSSDDACVERALEILAGRMRKPGMAFASPADVKSYLQLSIGGLPYEAFSVVFLDVQNRLIACEQMFRGKLTQTSVYPREVVKAALKYDAAAVVLSHNHPSGSLQPSRADESLTQVLKSALALVDVRVLDHIIVCGDGAMSMAEKGLV